jgi:hypothetical protein
MRNRTMKKLIVAFILALCALPALATDFYYCRCDTGAVSGCVAGSDANSGATAALARLSFSQYKTDYATAAAGSNFFFCEGGYWEGATSANLNNNHSTLSSPVVTDWYDASSVWGNSNGVGIKPVWHLTTGTILNLSQGTMASTRAGYTFKHIDFEAPATNGSQMILIGGQTGGAIFDTVTINGGAIAIQCNGSSTSAPSGAGTGLSDHLAVTNSTISNLVSTGILTSCGDAYIEGNTFTKIGTVTTDHAVYLGGAAQNITPPTISTITGDGVKTTVTTTAPHGFSSTIPTAVNITGVTGGTGSFNSSSGYSLITVTGASTFTYYSTGNGTGTPGTISGARYDVAKTQAIVRNNSFTENNVGAAGSCNLSAIVAHGNWTSVLIENNTASETVAATNGSCMLVEIDSGAYTAALEPEGAEAFTNFVVRNNKSVGLAIGIMADACANCLIENNYVYTSYSGAGTGIRVRAKNFSPAAQFSGTATSGTSNTLVNSGASFASVGQVRITGGTGSGQTRRVTATTSTTLTVQPAWSVTPDATSTYVTSQSSGLDPELQSPNQITIRHNTVHVTAPNTATGYAPIVFNCNVTDVSCGTGHNLYGNLVVMEGVTSTSHHCYDTTNMTAGMFTVRDYNTCYYKTSGAVPGFDPNLGASTHDTIAATTDVTTGNPFFTSAGTSPAVSSSSGVKDQGHPTLIPYATYGGFKRAKSPSDRGASEIGAASAIPNSPGRMTVQ